MKPVDMTVLHDPENGAHGDCQRACIASLLELQPEEVPHFFEKGNDLDFFKSLNAYLAELGYLHLETTAINFGMGQFKGKPDIYHLIYGKSLRGTQHAVVGFNGEIVHDPHPDKTGLDEEQKDGWHYAFLVPTFNT